MKRLAFAAAVVLTLGAALSPRVRCWWRGRHNPVRSLLGGFRCTDCNAAGESLEEMGFPGGGWVAPMRRTFERKHGAFTVEERTH